MSIMHCLAVELLAMLDGVLTAGRHRSVVAMAIVEVMVHMTVEVIWPVKPWSCSDEDAAIEPLGAVVSVRSAIVRRLLVVTVGADGWSAYLHRNLSRRFGTGGEQQASRDRDPGEILQSFQDFTSEHLD